MSRSTTLPTPDQALPGREGTIRSYSGVDLLILDEASRVPDDLYRSVRSKAKRDKELEEME